MVSIKKAFRKIKIFERSKAQGGVSQVSIY
jgi:hypothetical protein